MSCYTTVNISFKPNVANNCEIDAIKFKIQSNNLELKISKGLMEFSSTHNYGISRGDVFELLSMVEKFIPNTDYLNPIGDLTTEEFSFYDASLYAYKGIILIIHTDISNGYGFSDTQVSISDKSFKFSNFSYMEDNKTQVDEAEAIKNFSDEFILKNSK